ncbi:neuraminidase-like domain-containing protein [Nannocystaceae bacterium ST9]
MALRRRDALIDYVVAHERLADVRELSELLLVDVEMQPCARTSRIKEAAAAVQLYFHRYFVDLERLDPKGDFDELARRELAERWQWMKNYRVWEANRKVFLFPENFIRPELRQSKTPAFKTLEDELLQGEITSAAAQRVYKRYLDAYTEVSRLAIAGGYVYDDPESGFAEQLVLFGRTRSDPARYFQRSATFVQGRSNSVVWAPWLPVGIEIAADRVYPVYAFGRVFVFWAELETRAESSSSAMVEVRDVEGGREVSNHARVTYVLNVRYSYYNLNGEWIQPQLLRGAIEEIETIREVELFVERADVIESSAHEHVVIGARYSVSQGRRERFFSLSGDFVLRTIPAPPLPGPREDVLVELFASSEHASFAAIGEVVALNSYQATSKGPWFSFDYKGGSFLCKPSESGLGPDNLPRPLAGNDEGLPAWPRIDAAVQLPSGERLFFDNAGRRFASQVGGVQSIAAIDSRFGLIDNAIARDARVDAALTHAGMLYLFRGDEYLRYRAGHELAELAERDGPTRLAGNPEGFPAWPRIHAALEGADGVTYLFGEGVFVTLGNLAPRSIKDTWGRGANAFADRGIDGAFVSGERTYLIAGDRYVRYSGAEYREIDLGYPKPANLFALLDDLGCTNNKASHASVMIVGGYATASKVVLTSSTMTYTLEGGKVTSTRGASSIEAQLEWGAAILRLTANGVNEDGNDMVFPLRRPIAAAMIGRDRVLYLFSGVEFIAVSASKSPGAQGLAKLIDQWSGPTRVDARFGVQLSPIAIHNRVDAAFRRGEFTFLVTGDAYVRYTGASYQQVDLGYPRPLAQNPDGLPQWSQIDAAFTDGEGRTLFFREGVYASSDDPSASQPIFPRFGRIATNVLERGVDVAWVAQNRLYLGSGRELIHYSLATGALGRFADAPPIAWGPAGEGSIDAAISSPTGLYLFGAGHYARAPIDRPPPTGFELRPIVGNWGNLLPEYRLGFDASLTSGGHLYLFKDDHYCRYVLDDPEQAEPYEIQSARFDIIRLTTSTASLLTQRLFAGGLAGLLALDSQELDETPAFSKTATSPTTIQIRPERIAALPVSSHLDFESANGVYYWEIFFHAPFLIAQSLSTAQKFADAKLWYEYVFDPTDPSESWKFLPFLAADLLALFESGRGQLDQARALGVEVGEAERRLDALAALLTPMQDAFLGLRNLDAAELARLEQIAAPAGALESLRGAVEALHAPMNAASALAGLRRRLLELIELFARLARVYDAIANSQAQLATYLDDPFDPHAIAALRRIAYRKAIVMRYIDNLLDWGDMLFAQYDMESIQEARMLYMLAQDLLGRRPQALGERDPAPARSYRELHDLGDDYDFLLHLEDDLEPALARLTNAGTLHDSIVDSSYFHVPHNREFVEYWDRVEDRLFKIRHCLNLAGERQELPLFQPPIDPMALVRAAASGAGFADVQAALFAATPHYRFTALVERARALAQRASQLGEDLLAALDRRDGERLNQLNARQEGEIKALLVGIRQAQLDDGRAGLASLREAKRQAALREKTYSDWVDGDFSAWEVAQMSVMGAAVISHAVSAVSRAIAAAGGAAPDALVGPFIMGAKYGGTNANAIFDSIAAVTEALGEGLSIGGELLGVVGQHERSKSEWKLQRDLATIDVAQLDRQIAGAEAQVSALEQELALARREVEHNRAIATFYRSKFTNDELYQWMSARLSAVFFQTYRLALDAARSAERAFQYERGAPERQVAFIGAHAWDSQRKGLLAGASLGLDIDRMEQAFVETDARRLEIGKDVSLLEHDPLALLELKATGSCVFHLGEGSFDHDFPGHYRRQVKTIALVFDVEEGVYVNATLTQLADRTVLEPDPKAVQFLLAAKDDPPPTIRTSWKGHQQIALSQHDPYEDNNGLFELRFDNDRYLPFEGTGAVSSWRLQLGGQTTAFDVDDLLDVTIKLKYTALDGGEAFAQRVRGLLKPYDALRLFDMSYDFADSWPDFLADPEAKTFPMLLTRELFPNLSSSRIAGVVARIEADPGADLRVRIDDDPELELRDGGQRETSGLRIAASGTTLALTILGDKSRLRNLALVLRYKAKAG